MSDTLEHTSIHFFIRLFAIILIAFGVFLLLGGAYLKVLGGSWYYALAGLGLTVSGALCWKGRIEGIWLYLGVFVVTVVWALWEVGVSFWPLVPRLIAPLFLAAFALVIVPLFPRAGRAPRTVGALCWAAWRDLWVLPPSFWRCRSRMA